jgi:hypothetical protein
MKDSEELLESFNAHGVRYVIIGAHALALHGHPRHTKDFDLLVEPSPQNAVRVVQALDAFGFGAVGLETNDFSEEGRIIQLGFPPNRVDLCTSIDGVSFEEVWSGSLTARFGEATTRFIGKAELIRNKRAAGRPQDLLDVELLERE